MTERMQANYERDVTPELREMRENWDARCENCEYRELDRVVSGAERPLATGRCFELAVSASLMIGQVVDCGLAAVSVELNAREGGR